jgi:hypothetical protein
VTGTTSSRKRRKSVRLWAAELSCGGGVGGLIGIEPMTSSMVLKTLVFRYTFERCHAASC